MTFSSCRFGFSEKDYRFETVLYMIFKQRYFETRNRLKKQKKLEKMEKSIYKIMIRVVYCMGIPEKNQKM